MRSLLLLALAACAAGSSQQRADTRVLASGTQPPARALSDRTAAQPPNPVAAPVASRDAMPVNEIHVKRSEVLARIRPSSRSASTSSSSPSSPSSGDIVYAPVPPEQQTALGALVREILGSLQPGAAGPSNPQIAAWRTRARANGYEIERWRVQGERYLALVELPMQRRGGGSYVFRMSGSTGASLVLQAPHAYFDLRTGEIAIALFFAMPGREHIRALYVNSVHRYQGQNGPRSADDESEAPGVPGTPGTPNIQDGQSEASEPRASSPADVCHNPDHLYNTLTRAAAEALDQITVIQLHGFGERTIQAGDNQAGNPQTAGNRAANGQTANDRIADGQAVDNHVTSSRITDSQIANNQAASNQATQSSNPASASLQLDAVVSTTVGRSRQRSLELTDAVATALAARLPGFEIRRYPSEYSDLGGVTNVQRRLLRGYPGAVFVHLELSRRLRRELRKSSEQATQLAAALMESLVGSAGQEGGGP